MNNDKSKINKTKMQTKKNEKLLGNKFNENLGIEFFPQPQFTEANSSVTPLVFSNQYRPGYVQIQEPAPYQPAASIQDHSGSNQTPYLLKASNYYQQQPQDYNVYYQDTNHLKRFYQSLKISMGIAIAQILSCFLWFASLILLLVSIYIRVGVNNEWFNVLYILFFVIYFALNLLCNIAGAIFAHELHGVENRSLIFSSYIVGIAFPFISLISSSLVIVYIRRLKK